MCSVHKLLPTLTSVSGHATSAVALLVDLGWWVMCPHAGLRRVLWLGGCIIFVPTCRCGVYIFLRLRLMDSPIVGPAALTSRPSTQQRTTTASGSRQQVRNAELMKVVYSKYTSCRRQHDYLMTIVYNGWLPRRITLWCHGAHSALVVGWIEVKFIHIAHMFKTKRWLEV